ncbi:MAG: hypothetical protein IKL18_07590 [Oscillospiraceae bacterium]|nr:hypothetical protein [Oscillospiraceae bacterium]
MKKLFLLLGVICLCFCGCVSTEPQIDPNLIKIEITHSDSENITFDVINNAKDNIEFGSEYYIDYFDGENWVTLEERTETFFTTIAHILAPGGKMNFSFDIASRYGELSSGKYRIWKDVRLLNEDGEVCGSQRVYGEFEVQVLER